MGVGGVGEIRRFDVDIDLIQCVRLETTDDDPFLAEQS